MSRRLKKKSPEKKKEDQRIVRERVRRIALLTSGGDAPGLNGVIRAAVKTAILQYGMSVFGVREGFEGLLMDGGIFPLDMASVRGLLPRGGTILGTRNTGEYHAFFERGTAKRRKELLWNGVRALNEYGIDALIAIGGEGSLYVASEFQKYGFPVVGVPKTIDNDLAATDYTFGFDTAVTIATEALDRLTTTAESHDRVMILEVMGRGAGWIALAAGIAGGADIILIPEIPFSIGKIVEHIRLRESTGARFHIIVVAEGARPKGRKAELTYTTPKGKKRLGGIAAWLAGELGGRIENEIRYTVLGHLQRGGSPTAFDRILATRFGAYAVHLAARREFGRMVSLRTPEITSVPIEEAIRTYHRVHKTEGMIRTARSIGLTFGD